MNKAETLINAHACWQTTCQKEDDCKNCPYGYGVLDDHGDRKFWTCDSDKIYKDTIDLLVCTKTCLSTIAFMLSEYSKDEKDSHVTPFCNTRDMAKYFLLLTSIISKEYGITVEGDFSWK